MRWNGLPWSEERWHCYSRTDRRWRSTRGYGWQMTREQFEMVLQTTATMMLQESEEWSSHYMKRSMEERPDRWRQQEWRGLFTYKQLRQVLVWFKSFWIWRKVTLMLLSPTITTWYLDGREAKHARLLVTQWSDSRCGYGRHRGWRNIKSQRLVDEQGARYRNISWLLLIHRKLFLLQKSCL